MSKKAADQEKNAKRAEKQKPTAEQQEQTAEQMEQSLFAKKELTNSVVRLIGDKITICQVVQLLAYIRHAIQHKKPMKVEVNIGSKLADGEFLFDVNQQEIRDYVTQPYIEIN